MINRQWISQQYAKGAGIEIGAFHNPWPYDPSVASIHYVDKAASRDVLDRYPDMPRTTQCVTTHWTDDGEFLTTVPDKTYDFLFASHVLEHMPSPLTGIENHLRVVKSGGHVIYALPDKRHTFDKKRENARFSCLTADYIATKAHPSDRRERMIHHHHDYLLNVDGIQDGLERRNIAIDRLDRDLDIHYHAWDAQAIYEMFTVLNCIDNIQKMKPETVLFYPAGHEVFIILRRTL